MNKAFQKRYFVLKGNLLFYFEKQTDKEPVGVIILEGCTIELAEEEIDKFAFKISFHGEGKRVYTLGTENSVSSFINTDILFSSSNYHIQCDKKHFVFETCLFDTYSSSYRPCLSKNSSLCRKGAIIESLYPDPNCSLIQKYIVSAPEFALSRDS